MSVKILDAGGKLVLTGEVRAEVEAALADQIKRGATSVATIQLVGNTWIGACTLPIQHSPADTTSTLSLAEITEYAKGRVTPEPEFSDGCRVEEMGFKMIVTGPSRTAVEQRLTHLKQFGGELVGAVEQDGESWVAVVDTGGANKTFKY